MRRCDTTGLPQTTADAMATGAEVRTIACRVVPGVPRVWRLRYAPRDPRVRAATALPSPAEAAPAAAGRGR